MWPVANEETFNRRQKVIRDLEWGEIEKILAELPRGRFLDVGCGTGYALGKAKALGFDVTGLEPSSNKWGVHDQSNTHGEIVEGVAETIPFGDATFDLVYSSHALEHFADRHRGLTEIQRVLRSGGTAILVMPTGTLALLSSVFQLLFTTHIKVGRFVLRTRSFEGFRDIFFPAAHGAYKWTTWQEVTDFSVSNWRTLVGQHFKIHRVLRPYLFPWPDFPQLFPIVRSRRFSCSVILVCRKH